MSIEVKSADAPADLEDRHVSSGKNVMFAKKITTLQLTLQTHFLKWRVCFGFQNNI